MTKLIKKILKPVLVYFFFVTLLFLKKLFNVRFSTVSAERIGDLAASCDLFIKKKIIYPNNDRVCFIVEPPSNKTLLKLIKKHIFTIESRFGKILINHSKQKLINHDLYLSVREDHFAYKEYDTVPPQLSFSLNQTNTGFSQLKKIGISEKDWWVCFHVRDSQYLKKLYKNKDMSYHDYRDFSEESLHEGVIEVTKRGGFAILMSEKDKSPKFKNNDLVVQYNKNTFKSDFLDIFLAANAKFFIGSSSGLTTVPKILGTPVGVSNQIGFNFLLNQKKSLMIFKKLFDTKNNKILTYDNILEIGLFDKQKGHDLNTTKYLTERNLKAIENNSAEIIGLVRDMFDIVEKKNKIKYEVDLQNNFKKLFYSRHENIDLAGNIAPSFIKLNSNLFTNLN